MYVSDHHPAGIKLHYHFYSLSDSIDVLDITLYFYGHEKQPLFQYQYRLHNTNDGCTD